MGYLFIFLTIVFTVYGQLIVKDEIAKLGVMPTSLNLLLPYLVSAFLNIKIICGILSAVLAMICWFGAISRMDLSYAYPFMSLTFPIVIILSIVLFNEPFYWSKLIGVGVIVLGLVIVSAFK